MFGREPMLPIDIEFGVRTPDVANVVTHKYIKKLQNRMRWAFKRAAEISMRESARQKRYYDRKIKCSQLKPGDLVLVRQKAFKGKHKIQDKWENTPYQVIQQVDPKLPVFRVESTGDTKRVRVLHRNMLFPLLTQEKNQDLSSNESETQEKNDEREHSSEDDVLLVDSSDEESESQDPAEEPYTGPMTRSRTQGAAAQPVNAVLKANTLMEQHFGVMSKDDELEFDPNYPDLFARIEDGFTSIRRWWTKE